MGGLCYHNKDGKSNIVLPKVAGVIITLGPHVSSGAPDKFKCAFFPIKVRDKVSTALIPAQHHGSGSTMQ